MPSIKKEESPFNFESDSPASLCMAIAALGKQHPVYYDEHRSMYVVLRHKDVKAALHNTADFSNTFYQKGPVRDTFVANDGEIHARQRRWFGRAFGSQALRDIESRIITPVAKRVVDRIVARGGRAELVDDFCFPLPIGVISPLIGVEAGFVEACREEVTAIVTWNVWVDDPEMEKKGWQALTTLTERMRPFVEDQVRSPGPNIVGELIRAQQADGMLDVDMVLRLAVGLIMGGYETTTWMMGCALSALLMHPEVLERVRANRALLMPAVEESMRWANSTLGAPRLVTRDLEIGGTLIPKGSSVLLATIAAHYDDEVYANPEVFDIDRRPEHMLFGAGVHFCLGAPLARMEAKIGLNMLLDRLPNLRLPPDERLHFALLVRGSAMHGPQVLPVIYDEAAQELAA